jgi:cytochrome b involved in lipid metabolism
VPHVYSRAELASIHNDILDGKKEARKLIVVDDKVYDITDFTLDHPGGKQVILTQEGRDASGKKKKKKKKKKRIHACMCVTNALFIFIVFLLRCFQRNASSSCL